MSSSSSHRWRQRGSLNIERIALLSGSMILAALSVLGMGAPRNWWTRNVELSFLTNNASGLNPGMPVKIAGFQVGRVRQISLLNDAQVLVMLTVGADQEHMIGRRSRATLNQDNLLDKAYIAITPDLERQNRNARGTGPRTLNYQASPSLATLIRELAANRLPLERVITSTASLVDQRLPRSLDQLDRTLISGQRLAGNVERELIGHSSDLRQGVNATTDNLERTLTSVQTTLNEIQTLARSSNALLQTLRRSWLVQLLQPSNQPQAQPEP